MQLRPVMMTAGTIILGLLPILYGTGTGSEVMSRIVAPMVGGMVSAVLLTLLVIFLPCYFASFLTDYVPTIIMHTVKTT